MATWGWLMTGTVNKVPNGPALVMVKVPPLMSSMVSRLVRARSARLGDLPGQGPQALAVGVVDDRDEEALEVEVDGDAEVDVVVHDQGVVADRAVDVGAVGDGVDHRPGDEGEVGEAEPSAALNRSFSAWRTRSTAA